MQAKDKEPSFQAGFRPLIRREYMFDVDAYEHHYCPFCGRQLLPDQQTYCRDLGADDYLELLFFHQGLSLMREKKYEQALSIFKRMRLKRAGAVNFYKAICYFRSGQVWQTALCWSRAIRYQNNMALLVLARVFGLTQALVTAIKRALCSRKYLTLWRKLGGFFLRQAELGEIKLAIKWLKRSALHGNRKSFSILWRATSKGGVLDQQALKALKRKTRKWLRQHDPEKLYIQVRRQIISKPKYMLRQEYYKCQS